jgi:putative transposase
LSDFSWLCDDGCGEAIIEAQYERTLACLNRNRRLAKDFEASIASAKAWVYIASVQCCSPGD